MVLEILILLLMMVTSGYFALAEIAVVSARKSRLQEMADEGNDKAKTALGLINKPSDFFSTIQIGMTMIAILAGAYGGETLAKRLSAYLVTFPLFAHSATAISDGIVVVIITYMTLIVAELTPKRIALSNPELIAVTIAPQLKLLSTLARPLVRLLSFSSGVLLSAFHLKKSKELPVTEGEIKVLLEQGTRAGVFAASERDIVESVFRFGDLNVSSVMTPRTKIIWFDINDTLDKVREKIGESGFSTFPVCNGAVEKILGVVQAKELLHGAVGGKAMDLKAMMRPPIYVPENTPAMKVLDIFRKSQLHVAFVVDEYGSIQGLVTLTNILETLVGDIPSLDDDHDPKVRKRADGSSLVNGMMPIEEFKDMFEISELPRDEEGHYQTLGGFVLTYLGKIPLTGDRFELNGIQYEVVDMDGHRVDKVLVMPKPGRSTNHSS